MKRNRKKVFSMALATALLSACGSPDTVNQEPDIQESNSVTSSVESENVTRILFSVPSPLESALMIQDCGIPYNAELLNAVERSRDYTSTAKKAINMGVYVTDLSYNNVFGQSSNALNTFKAIEDLSNQLNLDYLIDAELLNKFDKNINNKPELMRITSQVYSDMQLELAESEMEYVNALIVTGAWVEGMYITTALVDDMLSEGKVVERIAHQKSVLSKLLMLLEGYEEVEEVAAIKSQLKSVESVYNEMEVVVGTKQVEINDAEIRVMGKTELILTPAQLKSIQSEIEKIRSSYVQV